MGVEIILAIIGVISGGGLAGLIAVWSNGGRSYRRELREQVSKHQQLIDKLSSKVQSLEDEADTWKEKYFDLVFGIKEYRLRLFHIAAEHNVPPKVIEMITTDDELDRLIIRIEKI
ncbi:uncharacterized coiled-coil DUF342 family protein [Saccharothrix ecbatanensis]|uniref:Uncharacterized coiled-coil DUF342 family protein n=1 Tax=Saccharothrix ecbatanensis TaxID=1105145 RepID=A0A7W9HLU3_9PSEU|nr:hypothetical protein [Saccharothrix ecbatanensis]MBB5804667.1 uncharacterized coiled-coil DUF342 family protein [Saccharothrix ecbatanensis]